MSTPHTSNQGLAKVLNDSPKGYVFAVHLPGGARCTLAAIARSRFQALHIAAGAFDYQHDLLKEVRRVQRASLQVVSP